MAAGRSRAVAGVARAGRRGRGGGADARRLSSRLTLLPVGTAVGNVRNDEAELVAPAADLFTA